MILGVEVRTGKIASLIVGFVMAALATVLLSSAAIAQQSADDQYAAPTPPSGPAAEAQCTVSNDTDGVVNVGDVITCAGDFDVSEGASVVLQDTDGTQGTFVDGDNAEITEGSLVISVTADPINVAGGNGVLNTEGLFVIATTGIAAAPTATAADASADADSGSSSGSVASAVTGVLPDTGGFAILGVISAVMLTGAGLVGLRNRFRFSRER